MKTLLLLLLLPGPVVVESDCDTFIVFVGRFYATMVSVVRVMGRRGGGTRI